MNPEPVEAPPAKKHKNLYDSFITARDREERGLAVVGDLPGTIPNIRASNPDRPRQGNTVYVFGYNITEEILLTAFTPMGKIVNISMEVEKVSNFVLNINSNINKFCLLLKSLIPNRIHLFWQLKFQRPVRTFSQ